MGEYLHPGVYVEEKKFGTPPITGGSTSTGAFIGFAPRGPVNDPTFVTSWVDFVNKFAGGLASPYLRNSYLAYAVYGFFNNGGKRLWVVRSTDGTHANAKTTYTDGATTPVNVLEVKALDAGTWGNDLKANLATTATAGVYNLTIKLGANVVEEYKGVTLADSTKATYVETVVNQNSKFVVATVLDGTKTPTGTGTDKAFTGGADGLAGVTDTNLITSMKKFDDVDSINLLVCAESQTQAFSVEAIAYAELRKDCVFIGDGALNADFESIQTFKELFNSEFMALYYPWLEVLDPIGTVKKTKFVPTAGHIAGLFARIDTERGVFKAPAGVEANVRGVIGLKSKVNDGQQDILNPKGINVVRAFADTGIVVWGARTTANTYINVRRELNFVMGAILNSTKWAVFEPNNSELWRKIRNAVSGFLRTRYALGAYRGASEQEAFFVKCDGELNTIDEINAGRVNTEVGVAINKPGEFIIFRVGQWDGGGSAQ